MFRNPAIAPVPGTAPAPSWARWAVVTLLVPAALGGGCAAGQDSGGPAQPGSGVVADYPGYETWEQLVQAAPLVVRGTLGEPVAAGNEDAGVMTAPVTVSASASGETEPGARLVIRYDGPPVAGAPALRAGQEYVLVLLRYGDTSMWQFPNPDQSVYEVLGGRALPLSHTALPIPAQVSRALGLTG